LYGKFHQNVKNENKNGMFYYNIAKFQRKKLLHLDFDFNLVAFWKDFFLNNILKSLLPFNSKSLLGCWPMMQHQKLEKDITTRYYGVFIFIFMPLTSNFLLFSSPIEGVILGIHMHVCVYIWAPCYYALLMTIKFFSYVFIWFSIIHHYLFQCQI